MGRRLDWWLHHLLYAGPILAGVTLMDHVEDFSEFEAVGASILTSIPPAVESPSGLSNLAHPWAGRPFSSLLSGILLAARSARLSGVLAQGIPAGEHGVLFHLHLGF